MPLILASASPRRAELLTSAGFQFEVRPVDVDETPRTGEAPADYAGRVAREKADAARALAGDPDNVILAADTVVVVDGQILGKPADNDDARRMLARLSGRVHDVLTAVVVLAGGRVFEEVGTTRVSVVALTPREIDWYVDSGEPSGKAGAYAIQGRAARFIDRIEGSWSNVVGLPMALVHRLFRDGGVIF